ncbi:hypothetical protein RIR_jg33550.t1 [Rhizophagus irregularis DAOM 181602=DAOM 197198]|nr:hypothetical protein RIR_jg33550.t1 [Rhizophagus irregularis DAOM 181602=DAOM 197198]
MIRFIYDLYISSFILHWTLYLARLVSFLCVGNFSFLILFLVVQFLFFARFSFFGARTSSFYIILSFFFGNISSWRLVRTWNYLLPDFKYCRYYIGGSLAFN